MLDLDLSLFVTIAIIWILMLVLNKIFYKPVGNIIFQRETTVKNDTEKLVSLENELDNEQERVETMLADARKETRVIRENLLKKGEHIRAEIEAVARTKANENMQAALENLNKEVELAESNLLEKVDEYSKMIEEKFL